MKKLKYKGTGTYRVYSDIYLDVIRRGEDEHIEAFIIDYNRAKLNLPNLLAIKQLRDKLTEIIDKNKDYFTRGE